MQTRHMGALPFGAYGFLGSTSFPSARLKAYASSYLTLRSDMSQFASLRSDAVQVIKLKADQVNNG